jgi:hypothetical protein
MDAQPDDLSVDAGLTAIFPDAPGDSPELVLVRERKKLRSRKRPRIKQHARPLRRPSRGQPERKRKGSMRSRFGEC